jgi:IMP cyclohydrolase
VTVATIELEAIGRITYPGRIIIIGRGGTGEHDVVVYGVTGRSPSSQARRLVHEGGGTVRTEVTDPDVLREGNEQLLIYPCMRPLTGGLAVSNGAQTDLIWETASELMKRPPFPPAAEILRRALDRSSTIDGIDLNQYEPDPPAFTPRISGLLAGDAALAIIRRAEDGTTHKDIYEVPLTAGRGRLLATYAGDRRDPLPAFEGPPAEVGLAGRSPQETAELVYDALGPWIYCEDLRVGVAVLFRQVRTGRMNVAIINRVEKKK